MSGRIVRRLEPETGGSRLPLLGKLKVGIKVKNAAGKEHPASIDYFRADGKFADLFHKVYGEKPTKVEIVFFSNETGDVCSERYEVRDDGGRLLAEGDGDTWRCWSPSRKEYVFGQADIETIEKRYGKAKAVLTLRFILPRIPGVFGVWQFTTKGVRSSVPAIRDTFDQVREQAGFITNIPFDLFVEKVKSNKPGVNSVFPVVSLVPNVSQENIDRLAEYVLQSKQRLRGVLTETRIKALMEGSESGPVVETAAIAGATSSVPALPPVPEEPEGGSGDGAPEPAGNDDEQPSLLGAE